MALPNQNTTPATKPGKSPAPAATKAAAKTTRKTKPTKWRKMADQAVKFVNLVAGLRRAVTLPVDAEHVAHMKNLSESLPTGELDDEVATFVASLHRLDAEQVPAPKIAKASKFAVGDKVKIVKKFILPRYTAFADAADLEDMEVLEVSSDGRQFLCTTGHAAGRVRGNDVQIHIAAPKHIEKR